MSEQRKRIENLAKELLSIPEDKLENYTHECWGNYDDVMDDIEELVQEIKDY